MLGVGLNKTGTKTLGECLRAFGTRNRSFDAHAFELWRAGRIAELLESMQSHDSFEDWPWPLVYREFDVRFPDARFVLTTRRDSQTWFESLCKHAERTGPTPFREAVYGFAMPHAHRAVHVAIYERHNDEVREYFSARPGKLLEVCWERGDDWEVLANFLGLPPPVLPFPHENANPARALVRVRGSCSAPASAPATSTPATTSSSRPAGASSLDHGPQLARIPFETL